MEGHKHGVNTVDSSNGKAYVELKSTLDSVCSLVLEAGSGDFEEAGKKRVEETVEMLLGTYWVV